MIDNSIDLKIKSNLPATPVKNERIIKKNAIMYKATTDRAISEYVGKMNENKNRNYKLTRIEKKARNENQEIFFI